MSILKPGESKTFIFSFRSEKPGMFLEEWELQTEPYLLETLPVLHLSGIALQEDELIEARQSIIDKLDDSAKQNAAKEALEDIIHEVRSPTPPPPDMRDPETFKQKFELNNKHLGLYFT